MHCLGGFWLKSGGVGFFGDLGWHESQAKDPRTKDK